MQSLRRNVTVEKIKIWVVCIGFLALTETSATSTALAQELPALSFAQIKAESPTQAPATVQGSAVPASNAEVLAAAVSANSKLADFVQKADLSGGSDGLQKTLRNVTSKLAQGTVDAQTSFDAVQQARRGLQSNGDYNAALNTVESALVGMLGNGLAALDLLPYAAELKNIKASTPYAAVRLGQIATTTSIYNTQRVLDELRKELYALSLEVNVKAAALHVSGVSQDTLDILDYTKNMASHGVQWKDFDQKLAAFVVGASPEFKSKLADIKALAVYNLPPSR